MLSSARPCPFCGRVPASQPGSEDHLERQDGEATAGVSDPRCMRVACVPLSRPLASAASHLRGRAPRRHGRLVCAGSSDVDRSIASIRPPFLYPRGPRACTLQRVPFRCLPPRPRLACMSVCAASVVRKSSICASLCASFAYEVMNRRGESEHTLGTIVCLHKYGRN